MMRPWKWLKNWNACNIIKRFTTLNLKFIQKTIEAMDLYLYLFTNPNETVFLQKAILSPSSIQMTTYSITIFYWTNSRLIDLLAPSRRDKCTKSFRFLVLLKKLYIINLKINRKQKTHGIMQRQISKVIVLQMQKSVIHIVKCVHMCSDHM